MNIRRIAKILGFIVALGVVLDLFGIASNLAVIAANDGYMPVYSQTFEKPAVIDKDHRFQKHGRLMLLSDRIDLDLPELKDRVPKNIFGYPAKLLAKRLNYPLEGGPITASVGDIMQWTGLVLVFISIPPLIISIAILIRKALYGGKTWRG